ncbi:MAG: hypothetical protein M1450_05020 [Patescibacteria group bacterium]|nr:hypothetical protein [Patescibacteria group bacterium]
MSKEKFRGIADFARNKQVFAKSIAATELLASAHFGMDSIAYATRNHTPQVLGTGDIHEILKVTTEVGIPPSIMLAVLVTLSLAATTDGVKRLRRSIITKENQPVRTNHEKERENETLSPRGKNALLGVWELGVGGFNLSVAGMYALDSTQTLEFLSQPQFTFYNKFIQAASEAGIHPTITLSALSIASVPLVIDGVRRIKK